jgi:hypothetical protein
MTRKEFTELLKIYEDFSENVSTLYDIGLDLMEGKYPITTHVDKLLKLSITSHWGDKGWDWVSWFVYENEYGDKGHKAWDTDGTSICYSVDTLYDYLQKEYKKLTYEDRVKWFVENYYESGMELEILMESLKNEDLDNLSWNGEIISIPKFKI